MLKKCQFEPSIRMIAISAVSSSSSAASRDCGSQIAHSPSVRDHGRHTDPRRSTVSFLSHAAAVRVRDEFGTPTYVYHRETLEASAKLALAIPAPYGLTIRY